MRRMWSVTTTACHLLKDQNMSVLFHGITPGEKYGRLTAVSVYSLPRTGETKWLCWCDCGGTRLAKPSDLTRGNVTSCGCTKGMCRIKNPGGISHHYWSRLRRSATKRGLVFDVDSEYALYLFRLQEGRCALSGWPITITPYSSQTASMDRIDSGVGYLRNNLQWLHVDLNFLKGSFSDDYVITMARAISRNHECP